MQLWWANPKHLSGSVSYNQNWIVIIYTSGSMSISYTVTEPLYFQGCLIYQSWNYVIWMLTNLPLLALFIFLWVNHMSSKCLWFPEADIRKKQIHFTLLRALQKISNQPNPYPAGFNIVLFIHSRVWFIDWIHWIHLFIHSSLCSLPLLLSC